MPAGLAEKSPKHSCKVNTQPLAMAREGQARRADEEHGGGGTPESPPAWREPATCPPPGTCSQALGSRATHPALQPRGSPSQAPPLKLPESVETWLLFAVTSCPKTDLNRKTRVPCKVIPMVTTFSLPDLKQTQTQNTTA